MEQVEILHASQRDNILAWAASLFVALCCIFAGVVLVRSIGIFIQLFIGLGVELPLATRLLMVTYRWLIPFLSVGATILLIVKEVLIRETRRRLLSTLTIFVAAVVCVGLVHYILYLPLFALVQKLAK